MWSSVYAHASKSPFKVLHEILVCTCFQVQNPPQITWPAEPDTLYTLVMTGTGQPRTKGQNLVNFTLQILMLLVELTISGPNGVIGQCTIYKEVTSILVLRCANILDQDHQRVLGCIDMYSQVKIIKLRVLLFLAELLVPYKDMQQHKKQNFPITHRNQKNSKYYVLACCWLLGQLTHFFAFNIFSFQATRTHRTRRAETGSEHQKSQQHQSTGFREQVQSEWTGRWEYVSS